MATQVVCPFCHRATKDLNRHIPTHNEDEKLEITLFVHKHILEEGHKGYTCPQCNFEGQVGRANLRTKKPSVKRTADEEISKRGTKRRAVEDPEPMRPSPTLQVVSQTGQKHHGSSASDDLLRPSSSLDSPASPGPSSSVHASTQPTRSGIRKALAGVPSSTAHVSNPFSRRSTHVPRPSYKTPTPAPSPAGSSANRLTYSLGVRDRTTASTSKVQDVGDWPELHIQCEKVAQFLNMRKECCVLHAILNAPSMMPHDKLKSCDLIAWPDNTYKDFRNAFRATGNLAVRCNSCGCPAIHDISHNSANIADPKACRDEAMQEWIIGLSYFIWKYKGLRSNVLEKLGHAGHVFGGGPKGMISYATWLTKPNGRNMSMLSNNLLDILYVYAKYEEELTVFDKTLVEKLS